MNRVCLVGRLTKDPVCEYVNSANGSIARSRFTIAVDRGFGSNTDDGRATADFISITAWRKQAENITKFQKKGNQIAIEGRLQVDNYTGKDGNQVWSTYVVADTVQFLDRKGSGTSEFGGNSFENNSYSENNNVTPSDFSSSSDASAPTGVNVWDAGSNIQIDEDELPFY